MIVLRLQISIGIKPKDLVGQTSSINTTIHSYPLVVVLKTFQSKLEGLKTLTICLANFVSLKWWDDHHNNQPQNYPQSG